MMRHEFPTRSGIGTVKSDRRTWQVKAIAAAARMAKSGSTNKQIGEHFGDSNAAISHMFGKHKITNPRVRSAPTLAEIRAHVAGKHSPLVAAAFSRPATTRFQWSLQTIGRLDAMYHAGAPDLEIAAALGCNRAAVRWAIKIHGFPVRGKTPSAVKALPPFGRQPLSAVKQTQAGNARYLAAKLADRRKPEPETERRVVLVPKMRVCLTCKSFGLPNPEFMSEHAGVRMCVDHRSMTVGID